MLINKLGAENVEFCGFASFDRIASEIDILVLPSYCNYESLPISIIEAMANEKPVIATDIGGCSEQVENERSGYLIPTKNQAALDEAINKYILNKDLIIQHGERGREIAVKKFNLKFTVSKLKEILLEIKEKNEKLLFNE